MYLSLALLALFVAGISWILVYPSRFLAFRFGAVAEAIGGRRIHTKATPQLGGLGIGITIIAVTAFGLFRGWFPTNEIQPLQIIGFLIALVLLLVVGVLDDRYDLSSSLRLGAYVVACLIVIGTGTGIIKVTQLVGYGGFSLVWWRWGSISLPSDLLTLGWLLSVTFATKFFDGLDGLVTGQTVIGAGLIAALALSSAYFQLPVAILAVIIAASFLGFLPSNLNPAKQFLGESGSVIAGFSLGFLSIVSGAKVATALMALGLPLADASLVIVGRLLRGASIFRGDDTHLHFKLLQAGLSQRQVVAIMWLIALVFGIAAFGVQTRGKLLLVGALLGLTTLLSVFASLARRSRQPRV